MNNPNLSFKKVLPTHSQLKEEDGDDQPMFENQNNQILPDGIDDSVN